MPKSVKVTILADRGFGDQALYELLKDQIELDFVVRFRGIVKVTSADGKVKPAKDWVPTKGRPLLLRGARVTKKGRELGAVVCVKAKGMKDAWHLASSHGEKTGAEVVKLYGKRFTIELPRSEEPAFRDGSAIAIALLTPLGAAGEALGIDSGSRPIQFVFGAYWSAVK